MTHHEKGLTYLLVAAALMSLDAVFIRLSGLHGFAPSFLFGVFSLISMTVLTRIKEGHLLPVIKAGGFMLLVSGAIMGVSGTAFTLAVQKNDCRQRSAYHERNAHFFGLLQLDLPQGTPAEANLLCHPSFHGRHVYHRPRIACHRQHCRRPDRADCNRWPSR